MDDRVFVQATGLASLDKLEHKGTESGSRGLIEQAGTAKSGGRWHSRDVRMRCCTPKMHVHAQDGIPRSKQTWKT